MRYSSSRPFTSYTDLVSSCLKISQDFDDFVPWFHIMVPISWRIELPRIEWQGRRQHWLWKPLSRCGKTRRYEKCGGGQKKTIEKLAHPISVILSPLATTDNYVIYVYVSILSFPCPRETMSFVFLPWKRLCCTMVVHVLATLLWVVMGWGRALICIL